MNKHEKNLIRGIYLRKIKDFKEDEKTFQRKSLLMRLESFIS